MKDKLTCIIVDDEPVARKILKEFVEDVDSIEVVGLFKNPIEADLFLSKNKVDLLFLDIQMSKLTGIQYLKSKKRRPMVIITTAFQEYAIEGYELNIVDYLLKPILFERFFQAVQKAKELKELKDSSSYRYHDDSYLFIKSEKKIERIEINKILYIESLGNYVSVYTETRRIVAYLTIKRLESQLDKNMFIKIHQSLIVSLSKVESIEGNEIKIKEKSLPISRNFKEHVMKIVDKKLLKR